MDIKVGNKTIMTITVNQIKCLKNDIIDPEAWFVGALTGKVNKTKKRMFVQWVPILRERGLSIPADDDELITLITTQPDYLDREGREAAGL